MKLTLGFSPCPNDTFIFDALVNGKIDTKGLTFDIVLEDVETLNKMALSERLDISKISYGVLSRILPSYQVLKAGGALGMGVGPLLVAGRPIDLTKIDQLTVAIPGMHTTAHMLFSLAYPGVTQKKFMVFSDIEHAVISGVVDLGVIIHENRFTYAEKGLVKLMDLGEHWEEQTGNPIPLGGIVMSRRFDNRLMHQVDQLIQESVQYARHQYPVLSALTLSHAQEMNEQVMRNHIDLYVNDYSLDLGPGGRAAVWQMLEIAAQLNPQPVAGAYEIFI